MITFVEKRIIMKNYNILLLLSLSLFLSNILINCSPKAVQYPNDSSELANLMREMYEDMEHLKSATKKRKKAKDFREKFLKMHNAEPTTEDMKKENYDPMAKAFMAMMDNFYTEKIPTIENYNVLVNSCINCHKTHCTGPVIRIKKLLIEEE